MALYNTVLASTVFENLKNKKKKKIKRKMLGVSHSSYQCLMNAQFYFLSLQFLHFKFSYH